MIHMKFRRTNNSQLSFKKRNNDKTRGGNNQEIYKERY